ncbi:hypothetical protein [Roseomonas elaeocarpi]|uniref:Uncharacterized protein n=1 Tax=Roseomonas elaeocarpi TaxID=907779 RepID=A0ABV6JP18_9PROT
MSTLLIGDFGVGDMAAEAALLHALPDLPGPHIVSTEDPAATLRIAPGVIPLPPNHPTPAEARRAVLLGPQLDVIQAFPRIGRLGALADRGMAIEMRNISFHPWGPFYRPDPEARAVLRRLERVSARDHRTLGSMVEWRCPWWPHLDAFPEAAILPHLPDALPAGPRLGLAIHDDPNLRDAFAARAEVVAELCAPYAGWTVVPLPVVRTNEVDDLRGIHDFAGHFLPASPLATVAPDDPQAWRNSATPEALKGWVASCDAVIAGRDIVVAFAAAAGVPCLALSGHSDDEPGRAAATLANNLMPGSRYVVLAV